MAKLSDLKRAIAGPVLAGAVLMGTVMSGIAAVQALEPSDSISTRKAIMWSIGAHVNGIKAGLGAKDGKLIAGHAGAIAALAATLPKLFPKGSGPEAGKTRAKPEIWQQWDKFVARGQGLADGSRGTGSNRRLRRCRHGRPAIRGDGARGLRRLPPPVPRPEEVVGDSYKRSSVISTGAAPRGAKRRYLWGLYR